MEDTNFSEFEKYADKWLDTIWDIRFSLIIIIIVSFLIGYAFAPDEVVQPPTLCKQEVMSVKQKVILEKQELKSILERQLEVIKVQSSDGRVQVGQVWELDNDNPFKDSSNIFIILNVGNGYVEYVSKKYKHYVDEGDNDFNQSATIENFKRGKKLSQ